MQLNLKSIVRAALVGPPFDTILDFATRCRLDSNYYNKFAAIFDLVEGACRTELLWPV